MLGFVVSGAACRQSVGNLGKCQHQEQRQPSPKPPHSGVRPLPKPWQSSSSARVRGLRRNHRTFRNYPARPGLGCGHCGETDSIAMAETLETPRGLGGVVVKRRPFFVAGAPTCKPTSRAGAAWVVRWVRNLFRNVRNPARPGCCETCKTVLVACSLPALTGTAPAARRLDPCLNLASSGAALFIASIFNLHQLAHGRLQRNFAGNLRGLPGHQSWAASRQGDSSPSASANLRPMVLTARDGLGGFCLARRAASRAFQAAVSV